MNMVFVERIWRKLLNSMEAVVVEDWCVPSLFVLSRALIVILGVFLINGGEDVMLYHSYAERMTHWIMPYREMAFEYPPGVIPFMLLPEVFKSGYGHYHILFIIEMLVFDWLSCRLVGKLMAKYTEDEVKQKWAQLLYVLLAFLMTTTLVMRFDPIPMFFTLLALYMFEDRHYGIAGISLGIGFAVKIYPIVIGPVFVMMLIREGKARKIVDGAVGIMIGVAALLGPVWYKAGNTVWDFLTYHSERGIQVESLPASLVYLGKAMGIDFRVENSYGSFNMVSGFADKLTVVVPFIAVSALLIVVYLIFVKFNGNVGIGFSNYSALLLLTCFICTNKVFSPQFMIWLVPFVAIYLVLEGLDKWMTLGMLCVFGLTSLIYPFGYNALIRGEEIVWLILLGRNVLMILLFGNMIYRFVTMGSAGANMKAGYEVEG